MKALLFYAITAFALNAIKAEDQQCPELNDENISCQDMSYLILENNGRNVPLGLQCMGYAKYLSPTFAAAKQNINLTTLIDFEFELLKLTQLDQEKNVRLNYFYYIQGVPTSLGYAKCNVLKLRKVFERSELRLQKDPKKGEISNSNDVTLFWVFL